MSAILENNPCGNPRGVLISANHIPREQFDVKLQQV